METTRKYIPHPLATLFPDATPEEDAALEASISTHGLLVHGGLGLVTLHRDQVLDGRRLLEACEKLGVEPRFETLPGDVDPLAFVLAVNVHRRNLNESQRAVVAYRLWSRFGRGAPITGKSDCVKLRKMTQQQAAVLLRVSRSLVTHAKRVFSEKSPAVPELRRAVDHGRIRVTDASGVLTQPAAAQRRAVAMVVGNEATTISQAVKKVNREAALREEVETLATDVALSPGDALTLHVATIGGLQALVEPGSVDVVITRPPTGRGTLELFNDLGVFAEHALRETGALIVVGGGPILPEMLERLSKTGLKWVGPFAVVFPGPAGNSGQPHRIQLRHWPVLVFGRTSFRFRGGVDVIEVTAEDGPSKKSQDQAAMEMLVQRFTRPGQTVCDPWMLDRVEVALGARRNGCNFVGASESQACVNLMRQQLEQEDEEPSDAATHPRAGGATIGSRESGGNSPRPIATWIEEGIPAAEAATAQGDAAVANDGDLTPQDPDGAGPQSISGTRRPARAG